MAAACVESVSAFTAPVSTHLYHRQQQQLRPTQQLLHMSAGAPDKPSVSDAGNEVRAGTKRYAASKWSV